MSQRGRALSPPRRPAKERKVVLFTLVASRMGNGLHPRCGDRGRESGAGDPDLPSPERYKQRMERGKGACAPQPGGRATLAVIGRGSSVPKQDTAGGKRFCTDRNATSCAVTATISSTRARGKRDVPGSPQGACHPREARGSANMMEPSPEKSKSVHRKTYERLWWEHHEAEMEQLAGIREWLDNSIRR
jgi:hypothetical protein